MIWTPILIAILVLYFILTRLFIIVEMREEVIQERLGKFKKNLKPGFHFLIPFADRPAYRREMREQVLDVPSQTCITKDNIEVAVDGLVYIKVMDAHKASYGINNYQAAAINLAQTTMRSEVGKITLDDTFSERETMNENIVREIDKAAGPWGIKVLRYEIKNIRPSNEIVDTMEKQMEAEREKRAEITHSEGFRQARINESEGEQRSQILISEGARQRRINEAKGKAKEIELIANATANGIQRIAEAMQKPGGELAVRTKLVEQYIEKFGSILKNSNVSVLPTETANLKTFFEGVSKVSDHTKSKEIKGEN
ncbi:MAG: paraslipin [Bacteroidetes bacterium]|jgi:regulator of protease activity HflC (stomatin/prohibitin superfamily)|nr:paraslipin [Bacteroidota bacterium]MAC04444.1 paraslipin [Balneola sp.]MAO76225.1 paraslipin [Balneola sp.]MBF63924.1 paraslipin [Balneola sp.]HCI70865.1 paraslipin [Balneola sp.]|tara:strand:+ start:11825 stop:12760 length:936 start_codon:yes stop_codon:yes gene_type:complete